MNIRHLEIFVIVCKEASFTKAAKHLYITQPAVSHAIHELELYTNTKLFERFPKEIKLTQAGKKLFEKATHLLQVYEDIKKEAIYLEEDATLRIGSSITIANDLLPNMLIDFKKHMHTPIEVTVASATTILQKLANNELDIGLVEGVIPSHFTHKAFYEHTIVPICHYDYPIKSIVTLEELVKHPLLLREKGSAIREGFDSYLTTHNISVTPTWTSTNSSALLQAVYHNFGIAILPENMVQKGLEMKRIKEIEIAGLHMKNTCHYVYLKNKIVTTPMKVFESCIYQ